MQNAKCKMQKLCACDRDLSPFCILHFAFCIRIERYDHESLVILRRAVAGESANGIQQRLLDLLGGQVTGVQQHALEALEAERSREPNRVFAKRIAPADAEWEAPR